MSEPATGDKDSADGASQDRCESPRADVYGMRVRRSYDDRSQRRFMSVIRVGAGALNGRGCHADTHGL